MCKCVLARGMTSKPEFSQSFILFTISIDMARISDVNTECTRILFVMHILCNVPVRLLDECATVYPAARMVYWLTSFVYN